MPIYSFACEPCGAFDVVRPVVEAGAPARCPSCGGGASRVFTPPGLSLLAKPLRAARDMEEKSAHEPAIVSTKQGRARPHSHEPSPPWVLTH
jgi:putative FmdB family regulatory protein